MDSQLQEQLVNLLDRIAIQDTICAVTLHSDLNEPVRQYSRDAVIDYSSVTGPEFANISIQDHRDNLMKFLPGFDRRQHQVTNFEITVNGDEASARSQARAVHFIGEECWDIGAVYTHTLRRTLNGWRIVYQKADLVYQTGESLIEVAKARVSTQRKR